MDIFNRKNAKEIETEIENKHKKLNFKPLNPEIRKRKEQQAKEAKTTYLTKDTDTDSTNS